MSSKLRPTPSSGIICPPKSGTANKSIESMPQVEQIDQYEQSDVEKVVEETGLTNVQAILDEAVQYQISKAYKTNLKGEEQ